MFEEQTWETGRSRESTRQLPRIMEVAFDETALFRSVILLCAKQNRQCSSLLALLSKVHSF